MATKKVLNNEVLEFDDWMQLVDVRCQMLAEKSVYELPEHNYQELYDQGWSIEFAAKVATQGEEALAAKREENFIAHLDKKLVEKTFHVDWLKAPERAQFHTFDEDGTGLWHQYRPHFKESYSGGYWSSKLYMIDSHLKMPDGLDWGNSLTERPK